MKYKTPHPNWRDADLAEIEMHRDSLAYFQGLDLRQGNHDVIHRAIDYHERELNECISDFKRNYPCTETAKIPFGESLDRLNESWGEARTLSKVAA